jgi:pyrimidine-nucleoside phosphorylase
LAPADGKLYALRDVTGTVPSMPLIASSVMSKKIASGAQAIVLDVKVGVGAFMPTVTEATRLARRMVEIGRLAGRKVVALISDMNQPLGHAVGNALEVREALDTLAGGGPPDFREHCLHVAAHMLLLAGHAAQLRAARSSAEEALDSGAAGVKFRALVAAQGGDPTIVDDPARLPRAPVIEMVRCEKGGHLAQADARLIGMTAVALGAGRARKGDPIDPSVGIVVHAKVGDRLQAGAPLYSLHASDPEHLQTARQQLAPAFRLSSRAIQPLPLFYRTVR